MHAPKVNKRAKYACPVKSGVGMVKRVEKGMILAKSYLDPQRGAVWGKIVRCRFWQNCIWIQRRGSGTVGAEEGNCNTTGRQRKDSDASEGMLRDLEGDSEDVGVGYDYKRSSSMSSLTCCAPFS